MTPPEPSLAARPAASARDRLRPTASGPPSPCAGGRRRPEVLPRSSASRSSERMTYRGDFLLGTILRFLPLITTILLWRAIYEGSGQRSLAGLPLPRDDRLPAPDPHQPDVLEHARAGRRASPATIREGTLKRYLIQPIDMIGYLLSYRVAHKVAYIAMSFLPYALLFFLCRGFFDGFPDALTMAAYAVSLCCRSWSASSSRPAWAWWGSGSSRSPRCSTS